MSLFKEKILDYMNDCMNVRQTQDYIENQKLLDEYLNNLSEYLEKYPDKETIEDLVVNVLIATNQLNDTLRYFDFHTAFFIGLNIGREANNEHYKQLIDSINSLISFQKKH